MNDFRFISKVYKSGIYLSLLLIVISYFLEFLININIFNIKYIAIIILVITPFIVLLKLLIYFIVKKNYYNFIISFILIVNILVVLYLKLR